MKIITSLSFLLLFSSLTLAAPATHRIAQGGKAITSVTVAAGADGEVRKAADDLAAVLTRMIGAPVEVKEGDGTAGIVVAAAGQFSALGVDGELKLTDLASHERYVLRSHEKGVYVVGATPAAARHGVWDLLGRMGYRQFFPGPKWEVVPSTPDLVVTVDAVEQPDYLTRTIWYGYGPWDYNAEPYRDWCIRNRTAADFRLHTGHAYDGIIHKNKDVFEAHPEYRGLVGGERKSSKLCIGNPGLRQFVVEYAIKQFEADATLDSISMDPSDGGGWCECEACAALGTISDRALTLANQVAAAVSEKFPGKYVGMYAYSFHSPPPTIRVHPNVIISTATSFIRGGFKLEDLMKGWQKQGAMIGIREYYSVHTWDRDMPLRSRGSNVSYIRRTIPEFYGNGARFMSSESSDNWGCNGVGYYLASRFLWDVELEKQTDAILDDFFKRAFGPAEAPMRTFYSLTDRSKPSYVFSDLVGRMYGALDEAKKLGDTPEVQGRIEDLVLYTRYVELFGAYERAGAKERQAAFEQVIRHGYRMRTSMMIHAKALYRDVDNRDKSIVIPDEAKWQVPEGKNPWKSSEPFTSQELATFVREGIANNPLVNLDFEMVQFSEDLVPATPLGLVSNKVYSAHNGRAKQVFWVHTDKPGTIDLKVTGGLIAHYRDRGNVKIDLFQVGGASETGERDTLVAHDESVPPDGVERAVSLPAKEPGLYRIDLQDGHDMTRVDWAAGMKVSWRSTLEEPINLGSRWARVFYVPKGTKIIGLHGGPSGRVRDPDGKMVFDFEGKEPNFQSIPVPEGMDGKVWSIDNAAAAVRLLNVPPYLARSAEELLLPREVVDRDSR